MVSSRFQQSLSSTTFIKEQSEKIQQNLHEFSHTKIIHTDHKKIKQQNMFNKTTQVQYRVGYPRIRTHSFKRFGTESTSFSVTSVPILFHSFKSISLSSSLFFG